MPSLADAILQEDIESVQQLIHYGEEINQIDEYGFTPLIEAAIVNNIELSKLLLNYHADPNQQDAVGGTALHWAAENNNIELCKLLLNHHANPNSYNFSAQSVAQFQNHFAARQLRRYSGLAQFIVEVIRNASRLIKYQQYQIDINQHQSQIDSLLQQEPLLIPVGYEGHAITFILYGDIWVKCDRREESRLYDNIMFYRATNTKQLTIDLFKRIIYTKQTNQFINDELDELLGLVSLTELKIESQISGNCSWANVEAAIPVLFFLLLTQMNKNEQAMAYYKTLALNFFRRWREWNKDRTLNFCIQSYKEGDTIRKACKAEILAAILFQRCDFRNLSDRNRIETILSVLIKSPYEYLLKNYLRVYFYENRTEDGKRFADMLREYEYLK